MSHFSNHSEDNYLKVIYKLKEQNIRKLNNVSIAKALELSPATVLEMIRKLVKKNLLVLKDDKSIQLTEQGKKKALLTIRRHRLWEVFLVNKLNYKWNEVHELAEELEHIDAAGITERLETFLGNPLFDPHGDPIPDKNGKVKKSNAIPLPSAALLKYHIVANFAETNDDFLQYLSQLEIKPGVRIRIEKLLPYDSSLVVRSGKKQFQLSQKVAENILVQPS